MLVQFLDGFEHVGSAFLLENGLWIHEMLINAQEKLGKILGVPIQGLSGSSRPRG